MVDDSAYDKYVTRAKLAVQTLLSELEVQPILFVGAGLSIRYFSAPDWHRALKDTLEGLNDDGPEYEYYHQAHGGDTIKIGSIIAERLHRWAWKSGRESFPPDLFKAGVSADSFLKHRIAANLKAMTPSFNEIDDLELKQEITSLRTIRPHAIITTNFDTFLETIFDGYESIVGQKVIRYNMNSFGEVYKIHGTVDDPNSIVITSADYEEFSRKKKYISAKLVTYLAEHPVFIFGYSFSDPNVQSILEDIGEIITNDDGVIPNIYYIKWDDKADQRGSLPEEHVISTGTGQYRVKAIVTKDFNWLFEVLAHEQGLKSINTKLVRALAARAYQLIRTDIPRGVVEVNYETLERVSDDSRVLPELLGITQADNPNLTHPFVVSQVAAKLGFESWQQMNKYIVQIKKETGIDIRATDNKYRYRIKTGTKDSSSAGKWSSASIDLLRKVINGEPYKIELN